MKNQSGKMILQSAKKQSGMLLIEVMIAIVIFSFGLLGLAGLQATATQNSVNAEERVRATLLVNNMVSMMWVRQTVDINTGNLKNDVTAWQTQVADVAQSGLNNAVGTVTLSATGRDATVLLQWRSPSRKPGDNNSSRVFTTVSMKAP